MRKIAAGIVVAMVCGVFAFAAQGDALSHGEFSQLLLQALATKQAPQLGPQQAMARVQKYGLMPADWKASGVMTHADLATVFRLIGISYLPADPKAPVSRPFAQVILRRYRSKILKSRGWVLSRGFSDDDFYLDGNHGEGIVSPSKF